jgi:hypothetical protein
MIMRTIEDVLNRLRAEFLEMPGLRLKPAQVQRLCGVEATVCQLALDSLVNAKFLYAEPDGHYVRLHDGADVPHAQATKAEQRTRQHFVRAS